MVPRPQIDRDKLRVAIRKLGDEYVYYMLDEAIDLLPESKLAKLAGRYLDPARLRPDGSAKGSLLADVKQFEQASLRGEYYEGFNVNSKNFMDKSKGTRAWISECHRLLDRCVTRARADDPADVRATFDIMFGLLRRIDECPDEVIFFADESGSWQVGVDWIKVLPPWFACLSATAAPDEFAREVAVVVGELSDSFDRRKHLSAASRVANPEQRKALRANPIARTPV
jgi:hypothetical protein